jgi:hypothetical protein
MTYEYYYIITAANYEHAPIVAQPSRRTEFQGRLLAAMQEIQAEPKFRTLKTE